MLENEGTILTSALLPLSTAAQQGAEIWPTPIEKFDTVDAVAAAQGNPKLIASGLG